MALNVFAPIPHHTNLYQPLAIPAPQINTREVFPAAVVPSLTSLTFSITEGEPDDQACAMLLNLKNLPINIHFRVDEDLPKEFTFRDQTSPSKEPSFQPNYSILGRKRSISATTDTYDALKMSKPANRSSRSISLPSKKPKIVAPAPVIPLKANPDIAQSHQARWMERFIELKIYKEKHATCNVTFAKEHEHYKTLAYWVSNQRISYRKKNMPQDRIDLLKSLGFDFSQVGREGQNENSEDSGSDIDKSKRRKLAQKAAEPFPRLPSPFGHV